MLQVVTPISFVHSAVDVMVHAIPVRLVVDPVTLINVAVDVRELALSVRPIVFPLSFVPGTGGPLLLSVTISKTSDPFARVCCTCFEGVCAPLFSFGVRIVRSVL